MDEPGPIRYALRAEMFKALGHPMRLRILERLREGPRCVCELAAELGMDKSVASKHLSLLRSVGLLGDERRGTQVEYRLLAPCILDMAACAESTVVEHRRRSLEAPPSPERVGA